MRQTLGIVCRLAASAWLVAALGGVAAASPAAPGFVPSNARPHGRSLVELATAYMQWALSGPPENNPLLSPRCEQSAIDPHIWFAPVSLGGEIEVTCDIPHGSFLVFIAAGVECSEAEGNGSTEEQLLECVEQGFASIAEVDVRLDRQSAALTDQIVTTLFDVLPADNVFGPDPTPTLTKGYFLVARPMSRGDHTLRTFGRFSDGFEAGATFTILVR